MNGILGALVFAIGAIFAGGAEYTPAQAAGPQSSDRGYQCWDNAGRPYGAADSYTNAQCKSSGRSKSDYQFGYGLYSKSAYSLTRVWLRARLTGETDYTDLKVHKAGIPNGSGVVFSFNAQWLADTLGTTVEGLKAAGFDARMKIEAAGVGGGRQDECPLYRTTWDAAKSQWFAQRRDKNTVLGPLQARVVIFNSTGGSVNDVTCRDRN